VVNSELLREGLHGFSFSASRRLAGGADPGIVYMLAVRFMLKTDNGDSARDGRKKYLSRFDPRISPHRPRPPAGDPTRFADDRSAAG
jgi:di/tricarboxylate transporter